MIPLILTKHGGKRRGQRGFFRSGLQTIYRLGEMINDQEIMMTDREIEARISELKSEIQWLDKLRNRKIVVDGQVLITGYCLTRKGRRRCRIQMRSAFQ